MDWLNASASLFGLTAPHWAFFALGIFLVVEWSLGFSSKVKVNSTLAAIAGFLAFILRPVPGLGALLAYLAQPATPAPGKLADSTDGVAQIRPRGFVRVVYLPAFALAALALLLLVAVSGCGTVAGAKTIAGLGRAQIVAADGADAWDHATEDQIAADGRKTSDKPGTLARLEAHWKRADVLHAGVDAFGAIVKRSSRLVASGASVAGAIAAGVGGAADLVRAFVEAGAPVPPELAAVVAEVR